MLSIGKINAGQARYYERQVAKGADDYYSGRGEAPGEWAGREAARLGLAGRVDPEAFAAMVDGHDPRDPEAARRLRASDRPPKIAAYDLTFSAPKSVSVLFATADEATSRELVDAHERAVEAALGYLEDEAAKVRRGRGGARLEQAGGLLAAAYRHRMSRALDPQLHTHVVTANLGRGEDGRYTGLWGTPLYHHAKAAGSLYQAELRAQVRERLGLHWGPVVNGQAELEAMPRPVLEEFSTRRREILAREAELRAQGVSVGDAGREQVAYGTRERKQYGIETGPWREEVAARAAEHGLDREAVAAVLADGARAREATVEPVDVAQVGDRLAGAGGLTERANAFATREAVLELAQAAGQGASVGQVRAWAGEVLERGDVLAVAEADQAGERRFTTAELAACERRLLAAAQGRVSTDCAVLEAQVLERALTAADRPLSAEQEAAVRAICTDGHGVDIVQARAGTGKTFTAGVLRQAYEDAGYRVIGVAPTGRAARELRDEAGIPAWTLARTLGDLDRYDDELAPGGVLILDEAGMAATRETERLLAAAERAGTKVVVIGDRGQLPSVQAGGWMAALAERTGQRELTGVMRQRRGDEIRALGLLHEGRGDRYLQWAREAGHAHVDLGDGQAARGALEAWQQASAEHGPAQAVLIARENALREHLNDEARARRREGGALGAEHAYGPLTVAEGDRVICRRNDTRADVDNGTRGTVRAVYDDRLVLETDAGPVRELPAAYAAEHVELAYALTGHGMQGGTVEWAAVVARPSELTQGWSYTALSRARGATELHIDAGPAERDLERRELAPNERREPAGAEAIYEQVAARMAVRDDEDLAVDQLPVATTAGERLEAGDAHPERGAERLDPPVVDGLAERTAIVRLVDDLEQVAAQRASLPTGELGRLERLQVQHEQLVGQAETLQGRLDELPAPRRSLLGTVRDDHATERARLQASVEAASTQREALAHQVARLERDLGEPTAIRAQARELQDRAERLGRELDQTVHRIAAREVQSDPPWAREAFGERPATPAGSRRWEQQAEKVARYRARHGLTDPHQALDQGQNTPQGRAERQRALNVLQSGRGHDRLR